MLLAIDAGNTNLVFALIDGGSLPILGGQRMNMRCGCIS
jgi:pantothenate kinase type III